MQLTLPTVTFLFRILPVLFGDLREETGKRIYKAIPASTCTHVGYRAADCQFTEFTKWCCGKGHD